MNFIKQVSLLIVLPLMVGTAHAQNFALGGPMQSMKLTCNNVKDIQRGFLLAHVIYNELTPTLEAHTVDRYIDYLDGSKIIFTKGDVETIQKEMKGIFTDLEKRDCKKLHAVQKLYSKRLEDRAAFAKATLNKDFKFDKKTRLVIDAKKRSYSANDKELKELQKKYLNFQVSNYLLSDEKLPDAVEKVKRSYDRIAKKLKDIKEEDMLTNYLNAFGRGLDAHTSYFSADMLEDFEISMRLSLQGIGATLTQEDGFTTVEALVKGGAADRSGLVLEKDKIIGVSQVDETGKVSPMDEVIEWDLRDVVAKIRGNKGTKVRLKIMRKKDGKPETLFVTLTRDEVKLEDEAAQISYLEKNVNGVNRKVGVINLPSFYADSRRGGRSCAEDVAKLIEEAKKQKVDSMVLDLSQNGGGSLSDAVDLAGLFFGTGNVVMQSSRSPEVKPLPLKDVEPKVNWSGPLVILTSRFSASASEIVAGALKDYGRAVVVGSDHTFGKGTVQQVIQLATGLGALKVTIGMFFTPSGFSTQHRGVASHIVFPSEFDGDEDEIGEKTLEYSLPPKQIDSFLSPQAYVTTGEGKWDKVDDKVVSTLKKRSEERVASSPEFAEIKKKVEKRKKDTKEIVLEDSFNDLKEKKDESDKKKKFSEAEKKAEYFKRADVSEAVNIAVDFVDIKSKVPLKVIAQSSNTTSDNRGIQSEKKPVQHEN